MPKSTLCSSVLCALVGEADGEVLEMRIAHLARPPRFWILHAQRGKLLGAEDDGLIFMRGKLHRLARTSCRRRFRRRCL